jgi:hypothetical protein
VVEQLLDSGGHGHRNVRGRTVGGWINGQGSTDNFYASVLQPPQMDPIHVITARTTLIVFGLVAGHLALAPEWHSVENI